MLMSSWTAELMLERFVWKINISYLNKVEFYKTAEQRIQVGVMFF